MSSPLDGVLLQPANWHLRQRDARAEIRAAFAGVLRRWQVAIPSGWGGVSERVPYRVARECVSQLDAVLVECPDAPAEARDRVQAMRDKVAAALAGFDSVFQGVESPYGNDRSFELRDPLPLADRYQHALDELRTAHAEFDSADESNVAECRAALDMAGVRIKALGREIAALVAAARYPALPNTLALAAARDSTRRLRSMAASRVAKVLVLHEALRQGAESPPEVAAAWGLFEGAPIKVMGADLWRVRRERAEAPSDNREALSTHDSDRTALPLPAGAWCTTRPI